MLLSLLSMTLFNQEINKDPQENVLTPLYESTLNECT